MASIALSAAYIKVLRQTAPIHAKHSTSSACVPIIEQEPHIELGSQNSNVCRKKRCQRKRQGDSLDHVISNVISYHICIPHTNHQKYCGGACTWLSWYAWELGHPL